MEDSEINKNQKDKVKTLQLQVFTDKKSVESRYSQKSFDTENQINTFTNVISSKDKNDGNALWVYQKTFFI